VTIRTISLAATAAMLAFGQATAGGFGSGGALYDRYCSSCHGLDGFPTLPGTPDFTRGESLLKSDPELIAAIRYGIRSMPGFDQTIDNEGMIDVVFYIRSLQR
jgi:mono/diheme cytochrome c family protein